MMIDMFLRPLLLLLLVFLIYCCFIGLLWFIDLFDFLYLLVYLKHTFFASIRTKREIMSQTPDSAARCPEHDEQPTYEEQALED